MPKFKLEEFLLPHEHDGEGKKLDEPKELDVEQLRKWAYGLLTDKEKAQEARDTAITERDQVKTELTELQRKNETDEQRRQREDQERQAEFEKLKARERDREKVDAIVAEFEEQGITPSQAKKLAKRVSGDDEKAWLEDARELVEDGFKIGAKKTEAPPADDDDPDDLTSKPRPVRRSSGEPPKTATNKPRSAAEELDAAGVSVGSGW